MRVRFGARVRFSIRFRIMAYVRTIMVWIGISASARIRVRVSGLVLGFEISDRTRRRIGSFVRLRTKVLVRVRVRVGIRVSLQSMHT